MNKTYLIMDNILNYNNKDERVEIEFGTLIAYNMRIEFIPPVYKDVGSKMKYIFNVQGMDGEFTTLRNYTLLLNTSENIKNYEKALQSKKALEEMLEEHTKLSNKVQHVVE